MMKKNMFKLSVAVFWVFACFFIYCGPVDAHDLWLNIDNHYLKVGEKTNVEVVFGHNFPYCDILISSDDLNEFSYLTPLGEKRKLPRPGKTDRERGKGRW